MNTTASSTLQTRSDVDELRRRGIGLAALMFLAVGGILSWLVLPVEELDPYLLVVYLFILGTGAIAYPLRSQRPRLAAVALLVGPIWAYALALARLSNPSIPFFAVLIVILNAAVHPLLGFVAAALGTIPLLVLAPPRDMLLPALALLWLTAIAEWVSSRGLYTALQWAWSSQQRANDLVQQLRRNQGELNRTIAALTEATRRLQRMGYDLAIARVQADKLRDLKSRFAANISHELRTPLNLILGFSETMHLTPDVYGPLEWPAPLRQDIRRLYQSSRQLSELIDDVLDLSRIDGGEMPIHRQMSDLRVVVQDALGLVRDLLRGRDLTLEARLPAELPPLHIDQTRVRQILVNLLNNAARFTERGAITVSAQVMRGEVIVSVADTGIGIPPDELRRIFDEYHQVDISLRAAKDGVGLGLAISRRFVELHGGRIWAESTMGEGSTFFFSLPLEGESTYSQLSSISPLLPRRGVEPLVILVDEDTDVHALLCRYLPTYHIVQAPDLARASEMSRDIQPHALLINTIPDPQRQQELAAQALRVVSPKTPVLLCSIPSRSWTARLAGTDRSLLKPVRRSGLIDALSAYPGVHEILIVDDDVGFVQLMVRYVQTASADYGVRWAYDGERALEMIRESPPDLILLDLIMPRMDGLELLTVMRSEPRLAAIPVIIVTATDYAYKDVSDEGYGVQLVRPLRLGALETIEYLAAILDVSLPQVASQGEPVRPAAADG